MWRIEDSAFTRVLRLLETSTLYVRYKGNIGGWARFDWHCGPAHGVTTALKSGPASVCLALRRGKWAKFQLHCDSLHRVLECCFGLDSRCWSNTLDHCSSSNLQIVQAPVHFPGCIGYSSTSAWDL